MSQKKDIRPPAYERLMTAAEAADILNVSIRSVRRLIDDGKIGAIRIGRAVRIHPSVIASRIEGT